MDVWTAPSRARAEWIRCGGSHVSPLQGHPTRSRIDEVRVEEIPDPSNQGPVIMISCVVLGVITGFLFLASLMFVSGGEDTIDQIIDSNGNPLVQILLAATNSPVACACLAVFPLISLVLLIY